MESLSPQVVAAAKLHIHNLHEFDLWKMRIEQYFLMTDYSLWEAILNGNSPTPTRVVDGVVQPVAPTTAEQRLAKKNELKARGTLLMALPDKNQLKFNIHKDAKSLMKAIKKRFGGNKKTKKVQKTLLKQQYENFTSSSSESLDQIHDRLQKLISQLEILGDSLSQKDINLRFLRSFPSEWRTHTLIWRNKADLEEQSLDNLFNNLKIYEAEVKISSSTSHTTQNIGFVNLGADGTTSIGFDMSKVECYNCHRRGHFARECRSPKDTRNKDTQMRNVPVETITFDALVSQCDGVGSYDWSFQADEEPINYALIAFTSLSSSSSNSEVAPCSKTCTKAYATLQSHYDKLTVDFRKSQFDVLSYKTGLEYVEARLVLYQQNENVFEEDIKLLKLDAMLRDNALTSSKNLSKLLASQITDKTGLGYDNQMFNSTAFDYDELISSESDESVPTSPMHDKYKSCEGYHAVPPPYTGVFMPPKPDLVFHDAFTVSKTVPTVFNVVPGTTKPTKELSQSNRPSAYIIEDWVSDSEDESEGEPMHTQKAPSFVQITNHVKTPRPSVKPVEHTTPSANLRKDTPKSRGHRHSWNIKSCFVCKSLNHLIKDCDYYEKQIAQNPVRNHAMRFNYQNSTRMTHPHSKKHVVPTAVLTRSRLVILNAARPVTTDVSQTHVKHQRPVNHGNLHQALKDKGVIDSGCSRHMTGNISYLYDFEEINEGNVAFGGNPKGGKITGKGKIKTGKLDFNDVYFVKELKFNLFSASQMCNKNNSVLFTETKCVVLSSDFKLLDENHVLLRVPRENNMYNVDLKNIVLSGDLTCLFAKATLDESNNWHRRLGHINFKTMNELVKGNLVIGLPSKIFENNHTCVACKKGKQHRASCKTKPVSSVSRPPQSSQQRYCCGKHGKFLIKGTCDGQL
nr:ribonuclease H-like domain-containing protein [Tanacetum cinerariifolium]